jgi:universal stress protein E
LPAGAIGLDSVMSQGRMIVAAVDFSSISPVILEHAAKMASFHGASVVAAHVLDESRLKDWIDTLGEDKSPEHWLENARERLAELLAAHLAKCAMTAEVTLGRPYEKIAEIVERTGAGLLVIGAHDQAKRRVGSVAAKSLRAVPSDVLLLRDWQGRLFRKVAVCVDFSETSAKALASALDFAEAHGAGLEIMHVIFPPTNDPWGQTMEHPLDSEVSYEVAVRARANRRMEAFLKPYAGRLAKLEHSCILLESQCPAVAISAHVLAGSIDLVALGTQGRSWLGAKVLGSTAARVLNDAPCSVLVVRPSGDR